MRILIISAYFPPYNAIGALRVGKLAKFLVARGHEVRVVSAAEDALPQTAELEIPAEHVSAVPWLDVNLLPQRLLKRKVQAYRQGTEALGSTVNRLGELYRTLLNIPDNHIGWYAPALRAGEAIIRDWRPDLIYASATPQTGLLVAQRLSARHGIPWVAELRDLWVDNHYYQFPRRRRAIDSFLERRVLSTAALLVTVSEPLAEILRAKYNRPTVVVMNGFDPADFPTDPRPAPPDQLTILYTGMIYPSRRDPTPLFQALGRMGPLADKVRVRFYGRLLPGMQALIDRYGVQRHVEMHGPVSYRDSLRLQAEADVLLLLLWDTPEERGVFTGKLFEYLGARRPILTLGLEDGVAADLIRQCQAGVVASDPDIIARQLTQWLEIKARDGAVPMVSAEAARGMTRDDQFALLEPHLATAAATPVRRQKVVVVTRKLDVGGTERHLLQVLPHLDHSRFDVEVVALRPGGRLEGSMRDSGVPVRTLPAGVDGWLALVWSAASLTLRMLAERRTIFHFFLPEAYAVGGLCGLLSRHRRLVMSRRSLNLYQAGHPWVARLERLLHRRMRAVAGNSEAVLADLRTEGVAEDHLRLIYNGIDLTPFNRDNDRAAKRVALGLEPDEVAVVMVANLIPYKGHLDLVEAFAHLTTPRCRLLLVGRDDGVAAKLVSTAGRLGLQGRVVLLGERDDIPAILAASDIGVLCSHQEGFANSILEGMAAGLPMVVTDVGGNREAVLDGITGYVVPPHDPAALASAIDRLTGNACQRMVMGAAGRNRVATVFSMARCIDGYEDFFMACARTGGDMP